MKGRKKESEKIQSYVNMETAEKLFQVQPYSPLVRSIIEAYFASDEVRRAVENYVNHVKERI